MELTPPNQDRQDDVRWSIDRSGHTFWSLVDSTPGYMPYSRFNCTDDCRDGSGNDDCPHYAHQRGHLQCVAANSRLERCAEWVVGKTPFCHRHLRKAWDVLFVQAVEEETEFLKRELESARRDRLAARETMFRALNLETALLWDAATAASMMPERVYFFVASYAVKIGRSVKPEQRVKSLTGTKAPADVDPRLGELVGTIPGGCRVESELHGRFRAHRLVGEWFTYEPIRTDIDDILAAANEVAA